ncbi:hypothetical protein D9G48_09875 [Escherichia coli]|nr:hypothetical protein [Escherichia coli]MHW59896.1 hypothetical protein [Escherichia coli]
MTFNRKKSQVAPLWGSPYRQQRPLKITRLYISCAYLFHVVSYSAPNGVVNGVVNLRFLALFVVQII